MGNELLNRLNICYLCIMSICNFGVFLFWFRGHDFGSLVIAYILIFKITNHIICRSLSNRRTVFHLSVYSFL